MKKSKSPPSPSPSSSSSEDEEEEAKLRAALDPSAFNLMKKRPETTTRGGNGEGRSENQNEEDPVIVTPIITTDSISNGQPVKSVRALLNSEEEFPKPYSLNVTPEQQKFIAKKLMKKLDGIIEETEGALQSNLANDRGIFLFSSSGKRISPKDLSKGWKETRKKPKIRRRKHLDGSESEDENEKVRKVAVNAEWVKSSYPY